MARDNSPTRRSYLAGLTGAVTIGTLAGCSGGGGDDGDGGDGGDGTATTQGTSGGDGTPTDSDETMTTPAEDYTVDELLELADPPDEIVFVNAPTTPHTHYAIQAGIFEDHGLNVTLTDQPVFDFSQNLTLAATGQADVSVGANPANFRSLAREQDIYMDLIYPMVTIDFDEGYYGYTFTLVNDGADIETYADLAGTEFAHFGNATDDIASLRWIADQHGIDPSNVCFGCEGDDGMNLTARVPLPQIVPAVARGEVPAGNSIEPRIVSGIDGGASVRRLQTDDGQPFNKNRYLEADAGGTVATWCTRPEFKEDHPHTTKLLQKAMAETLTHIYDEEYQDEYIRIGAETLQVSEDVYRSQIEQRFATKPVQTVAEARPWESMQQQQEVLIEYGDADERIDPQEFMLPWNQPQ